MPPGQQLLLTDRTRRPRSRSCGRGMACTATASWSDPRTGPCRLGAGGCGRPRSPPRLARCVRALHTMDALRGSGGARGSMRRCNRARALCLAPDLSAWHARRIDRCPRWPSLDSLAMCMAVALNWARSRLANEKAPARLTAQGLGRCCVSDRRSYLRVPEMYHICISGKTIFDHGRADRRTASSRASCTRAASARSANQVRSLRCAWSMRVYTVQRAICRRAIMCCTLPAPR